VNVVVVKKSELVLAESLTPTLTSVKGGMIISYISIDGWSSVLVATFMVAQ